MKVQVVTELDGQMLAVGQLFTDTHQGRLSSAFAYDAAYLAHPRAYAVDPVLPLVSGTWPAAGVLPRAFRDAAPDRWGRNLINRRAAAEAREKGLAPHTLNELDYLLGVSDAARQGALRFKLSEDGPFEHPLADVPKLVALPVLLASAQTVAANDAGSETAIKTLLDFGSASLGGARPKASVYDDGRLMVAKFAHPHDEWDVIAWEKTVLDLAEMAGIDVPPRQLLSVGGSPVLLLDRFDRTNNGGRVGYMSAMTLCEADDGEQRDYLEIAERLATVSADPSADLKQLWRRIAFGLAVNNTDDHLRNHGFLRTNAGWRLSPAFDINPNPDAHTPHATSIAGETSGSPAVAALMATVEFFGLTQGEAASIASEIVDAIHDWRSIAGRNGLPAAELTRFTPLFEGAAAVLSSNNLHSR